MFSIRIVDPGEPHLEEARALQRVHVAVKEFTSPQILMKSVFERWLLFFSKLLGNLPRSHRRGVFEGLTYLIFSITIVDRGKPHLEGARVRQWVRVPGAARRWEGRSTDNDARGEEPRRRVHHSECALCVLGVVAYYGYPCNMAISHQVNESL